MAKLSAIVAVSQDNIIGVDGKLPWPRAQRDMDHFREKTTNGVVIMGRGTWESLPEAVRPLPNRVNIVVTTDPDYEAPGAIVMTTDKQVLEYVCTSAIPCWVIGGAQIYDMFKGYLDDIWLTRVHTVYGQGTKMPDLLAGKAWTLNTQEIESYVENKTKFEIFHYTKR